MKTIRQISEKTIELVLLLILLILPFAYGSVSAQWIVFFSASVSLCVFFLVSKRIKPTNHSIWGVVFAFLFMLLFNFSEQVNFIRQFNIPVEITRHIPLSTVLLAVGMLALLTKTWIEGKVKIIDHPFARYFLFACVFLLVLMMLFYPFLYCYYQMRPGPDIQLLNKILKYLMISLLIMDYLSDEKKFRRMNLGFIFSISLTVILSILL